MSNADFIGTSASVDTLVVSIDERLDEARSEIEQLEGARTALLAIKAPAPKPSRPRSATKATKKGKTQKQASPVESTESSTDAATTEASATTDDKA